MSVNALAALVESSVIFNRLFVMRIWRMYFMICWLCQKFVPLLLPRLLSFFRYLSLFSLASLGVILLVFWQINLLTWIFRVCHWFWLCFFLLSSCYWHLRVSLTLGFKGIDIYWLFVLPFYSLMLGSPKRLLVIFFWSLLTFSGSKYLHTLSLNLPILITTKHLWLTRSFFPLLG